MHKKVLAIKKQQELLKKGLDELKMMQQQRHLAMRKTTWQINYYRQKQAKSDKRFKCVEYHLIVIDEQYNRMVQSQQWVTAREHDHINEANSFWVNELGEIRDELLLFEHELDDLNRTYYQHMGHLTGIERGLLCMKQEYDKLNVILNHLNNGKSDEDYNDEKNKEHSHRQYYRKSSFSFKYDPSFTHPTCTNFIQCLLRTKIVPCSSKKLF
ncbi:unnamed protein product [Cunninghamella blakesleeana]